jgi:hypothetical protein
VVKLLGLLAGATLALTATAATATGSGPPKPFTARYHLSGYGVYHETYTETWTAAPCVPGTTKGGGFDGTRKQVNTIKWETPQPGTAIVAEVLASLPPTFALLPGPNVDGATGVRATARVTRTVTGSRDSVSCHVDGTEERLNDPFGRTCGSHTYTKGYVEETAWPLKAPGKAGQQFEVTVATLEATNPKLKADYKNCWGPGAGEFGPHLPAQTGETTVSGALPFADLRMKVRGKATSIGHGSSVVTATAQQGGSEGGKFHSTHAYSATNYLTFVRIG